MTCSNCKQKQQQKSISDIFKINMSDVSVAKKAVAINDTLIKIFKDEHAIVSSAIDAIHSIFVDMFKVTYANHLQLVKEKVETHCWDSSNIYEIETIKSIILVNDTYSLSYYEDFRNYASIRFAYKHSVLSVTAFVNVQKKRAKEITKILSSKQDIYDFFTELNALLQEFNFKLNTEFDYTSNKLNEIVNRFVFRKQKVHSQKTIDTALTNLDSEKIVNMYLSANSLLRQIIKNYLFSKM